jgi:Spy/CpxP family protein refolding chaperone
MNRARIATGLATAAALALAATTLSAQAATAPAWRIVSQRHFGASAAYNGMDSVVVTSRANA